MWSVAHLRPTLCSPMDCSLPGSSICGTIPARILKWIAFSSFRGSSGPGVEPTSPMVPALAGGCSTTEPAGHHHPAPAQSTGQGRLRSSRKDPRVHSRFVSLGCLTLNNCRLGPPGLSLKSLSLPIQEWSG